MAASILDAGNVLRAITALTGRDSGASRTIIRIKVMDEDGTTLRTVATFASSLSVSPSPTYLLAQGNAEILGTGSVTATPSGGLAPYTYSWEALGGETTVNSPTLATTTFTSPVLTFGQPYYDTARCTCTDASGQTATADVPLTFVYFYT